MIQRMIIYNDQGNNVDPGNYYVDPGNYHVWYNHIIKLLENITK